MASFLGLQVAIITPKLYTLPMAEAGMGDVDRLTWGGANIAKDHSAQNANPRLCSKCLKNEGAIMVGSKFYCEACSHLMRMEEYKKDPDE
jgi:hypothetical protein